MLDECLNKIKDGDFTPLDFLMVKILTVTKERDDKVLEEIYEMIFEYGESMYSQALSDIEFKKGINHEA